MSPRKQNVDPTPPRKMTRRQLSRHQREVRRQRIAYIAIASALALVILIPLIGYWQENVVRGFAPVAIVSGETITADTYSRYLGLQQATIQREIQNSSKAPVAGDQSAQQQLARAQQQFLLMQMQQLPDNALGDLIAGKIVRDEAKRRGLTATPEELDTALLSTIPSDPVAALMSGTTDDAEIAKIMIEDSRKSLRTLLGKGRFLTEDEYNVYVLETNVMRDKLRDALGVGLPTSGPQLHVRQLILDTEEKGKEAKARLDKGDDFATVAMEMSTDGNTKEKGGDMGWLPAGQEPADFDAIAFSLPLKQRSEPTKTVAGYRIVEVLEKADSRAFESGYMSQQKAKVFREWLQTQLAPETGVVREVITPELQSWATRAADRESIKVTQ